MNINEVITDHYILREGYIFRDGYVFTVGQESPTIFDRLVVRSRQRAGADTGRLGYSYRTFEEHLQLIHEYQIEKVLVICERLDFLLTCPSVKDITVYPSYDVSTDFDYSPLYRMPSLKCVSCKTTFGDCNQYTTTIDYSQIHGLEEIVMIGAGHIGYDRVPSLKKIWISGDKIIREFSELSCSQNLEDVTFLQCNIRSLRGLESHPKLKSLTFYHNRALQDISSLKSVAKTLEELTIESCSKIFDFTALTNLSNLKFLYLLGNNTLPDLDFLSNMDNLMLFNFSMNVSDGNLHNCMRIPYVTCQNRKHYNLKDKDLPKDLLMVRKYRGVNEF